MEGFPIDLGCENQGMGGLRLDTVFQPAIKLDLEWFAAVSTAGGDGYGKICIA